MYNNGSEEFNNVISNPGGNGVKAKLVFSDFEITTIKSLKYFGGSNNSDNIAIGTTNSAYVTAEIVTDKTVSKKEFQLMAGVALSDGSEEYISMGYFSIDKIEEDEGSIKFTAYDRMSKFEKKFSSELTYPSDTVKVIKEICTLCGVTLASSVTAKKVTDKLDGYTCREVLGYMVGLHGGFACINRNGELELKWYSKSTIEKKIRLVWSLTKAQSDFTIDKVVLNKDSETSYSKGDGNNILGMFNPSATQDAADRIYTSRNGFTYRPATVNMLDDIRIDAWDVIEITYLDGTVFKIPVMSIQHDLLNGETIIKSVGESALNGQYDASGPITQAMERLSTELLITNRVVANKVDADWVNANTVTTKELNSEVAKFGYLKATDAVIKGKLDANELNSEVAKFGYLKATDAVIKGKLDANELSAKVAELGYLSASNATILYAKIDFSNVGSQVVDSSLIKDGAVTNEKVANLSANKITSGTIDASKINVTNLNADNLTVGTINGQRIGNKSIDLDKLAKEVPTKEYLDKVEADLQGQIDGNIETFTKTEIPTLNNEPANTWIDDATKQKHIGDICYVMNPTSSADGYCYRFADLGTSEEPNYAWVLIKDSDVTKALQDIITINGEITGIKKFDESVSSWQTNTASELSSIKSRTSTLETNMGKKVETSTFNTLAQTVDTNSSNITKLTTTVSNKADNTTVKALTNTVNEVKQTANSNTSTISGMQTTISNKADKSTVTELSKSFTSLSQDLSGFKTTVSSTYTTKTDFNNLEIGGTNLAVKGCIKKYGTSSNTTVNDGDFIKNGSVTFSRKAVINEGPMIDNGLNIVKGQKYVTNFYMQFDTSEVNSFYIHNGQAHTNTKVYVDDVYKGIFHTNIPFPTDLKKHKITLKYVASKDINLPTTDTGTTHTILQPAKTTAIKYTCKLFSFKTEIGDKPTDWSPAPGDVDTHITQVGQTANKINWLVKSGTSASNMTLTDIVYSLVARNIDLTGKVTFNTFDTTTQNRITTIESGVTSADNKAQGIINNIYTKNTTTINGGKITTGSIKATAIDVDNLDAIAAKIGSFYINEKLYSQSTDKSPTKAGEKQYIGIFQPYNIGEGSVSNRPLIEVEYRYWDNDKMQQTYPFWVGYDGGLHSTKGEIGGWRIETNQISNYNEMTAGTPAVQWQMSLLAPSSPKDSNVVFQVRKRNYDGSAYASWGNTFYVRYDGYIAAYGGGKIGAWNLGTTGNGALYNGVTSMTDNAHNGVYLGKDGIVLGKGVFKVTNGGVLTATSATISGTISAGSLIAKGTTSTPTQLGDWKIAKSSDGGTDFYSYNTNTKRGTGISTSGTNAIGIGFTSTSSWLDAPFRVTHDGRCYASSIVVNSTNSSNLSLIGGFQVDTNGNLIGTSSSEGYRIEIYSSGKSISGKGVCYMALKKSDGTIVRYFNSTGWH